MRRAISAPIRPSPRRPRQRCLGTISIAPTRLTSGQVGMPAIPISGGPIPICRLSAIGCGDDGLARRHRNLYRGRAVEQSVGASHPRHGHGHHGDSPRVSSCASVRPAPRRGMSLPLAAAWLHLPHCAMERGGVDTTGGENSTVWVAGDVLRAEANGTTLRLYRNNVLVLVGDGCRHCEWAGGDHHLCRHDHRCRTG